MRSAGGRFSMSGSPATSGRGADRPAQQRTVSVRVLMVLLALAIIGSVFSLLGGAGRGSAVELSVFDGEVTATRASSSVQDEAADSRALSSSASAKSDASANGVVLGIQKYAESYAADAPVLAVVAQDGQVVATYARRGDLVCSSAVTDGEVGAGPASSSSLDSAVSSYDALGSQTNEKTARSADEPAGGKELGSADEPAASQATNAVDDPIAAPADQSDRFDPANGNEVVGALVSDLSGAVAERTLLTTTSVVEWGRASDLLVWASVMQLVENNTLDLRTSVRALLPAGIDLPQGYAAVNMLDLMNHTTGLNVSATSALPSSAEGRSIVDELKTYNSVGAYGRGELVAYSSYDVALAAAVVEQIAGTDICTFIEQNILDPLGMTNTAISAGLTAEHMAQSPDERVARVASQVATVTSEAPPVTFMDALRSLTSNATDASVTGSIDGSALTCLSSVEDMAKLAAALVAPAKTGGLFAFDETAQDMFTTTRTFPGLGTRRCAHGLFSLPTAPRAVGSTGPSSGVTTAIYMDLMSRTSAVVLVGADSRAGLVQGLAGAALRPFVEVGAGQSEPAGTEAPARETGAQGVDSLADWSLAQAAVESQSPRLPDSGTITTVALGPDQALEDEMSEQEPTAAGTVDWSGVYQSAAQPIEGPSKLLGFFERTVVHYDGRTDTLSINGAVAKSLGRGVYVTQEPSGNDPYRFHVDTSRGLGYSRTTSDSYAVPVLTLDIERASVALALAAVLVSLAVFVGSLLRAARARLAGLRWDGQPSCLVLSAATTCAGVWTAASMLAGKETFLATMPLERVLNAGYIAVAALLAVWLFVTRWRGTARGRGKLLLAALCIGCAATMSVFFVYWDLLP